MGAGGIKKLSSEQIHTLEVQKNKSICKLRIYGDPIGYGFLCKILEANKKILIADKKILNSERLKDKKTLELLLNNDSNKELFIQMDKERTQYESKINEIFILEIREDDELKDTDFIEIENVNNINKYKDEEIYILPYVVENKEKFPHGNIKKIKEVGREKILEHKCVDLGRNQLASFFPILKLKNNKMIGINKDDKTGFFIKDDIDAFKEIDQKNKEESSLSKVKTNIQNKENETSEIGFPTSEGESQIVNKPSTEILDNNIENEVENNKNEIINDKANIISPNNDTKNGKIIHYIILLIKVGKEDFNKKVFFLGNLEEKKDERKNGFLNEVKKLGKMENFKLSISMPDNSQKNENEFKNFFKPDKIEGIYSIELQIPGYISDCSYMFYNCPNLIDVNLSNFDLSPVTKMNDMFNYCTNLTKVKFSGNETKYLDNMAYMFNYCKKLKSIDFKNITTENVTDMSGMFQNCEELEELDLTKFCTPNVLSLNCMCNDCYKLKSIKFSNQFNTDKVLYMNYMFFGCENLADLNFSYFSITKDNVKEMEYMIEGCDKLKKIFVKRKDLLNFKEIFKKEKDKFETVKS